ncbi:odv-e56 [Adoxophyes orana granulovirus]|uniref:Odv-e56 n=1 Tax=Adoxophyes orana granulovirus TaxID=170617 RepID=Q7TA03_GVAO|nr:odv-e56 [Adoxophyes orana granulovirus]AAP85649.1 odv-e56 [Adoxophyes orana granulovirus]AJA91652.1 ODV-E56 [Adoxophyes orana granulovirus]
MATFFTGLRRTNKIYPNTNAFIVDHGQLLTNRIPAGINLNNPTGLTISNGNIVPGYNINGSFVSNAHVNSTLRNNNINDMRQMFPDMNNNQINGIGNLRRADNIPDSALHGLKTRKNNIKRSNPETRVRDRAGVEEALNRNPRLSDYLKGAAGVTLFGVGVYLVVNISDLIGSIVDAINRTGGSWYYRGNNGGENFNNIESCVLRYRSCGVPFDVFQDVACVLDPHDPTKVDPLLNYQEAVALCAGYNYEREQSVCRASDTNADPESLQYLDISDLDPNQTIQCVEPYDFGDLIGDLGLEWLLGDNGVITNSSNSINSVLNNFVSIILVVGGVILLCLVGFVVFKISVRGNVKNQYGFE